MAKLIVLIVAMVCAMLAAPQGAEGRRWFPPPPAGQQCWRTERFPNEPQAGYIGKDGSIHSFGYAEEVRVCVYVIRHARAE